MSGVGGGGGSVGVLLTYNFKIYLLCRPSPPLPSRSVLWSPSPSLPRPVPHSPTPSLLHCYFHHLPAPSHGVSLRSVDYKGGVLLPYPGGERRLLREAHLMGSRVSEWVQSRQNHHMGTNALPNRFRGGSGRVVAGRGGASARGSHMVSAA